MTRAQAASLPGCPQYTDSSFHDIQRKLEELVRAGADAQARERFITAVFIERNRRIRNLDFRRLNPMTVAEDYLLPRKDLYTFTLCNWVRHILLPS
ncbi:MAG TPA: hypothetical protein VMC79_07395, partial [Rectinemataceae bacterium]|nr:hypothetical protein [Rectinemataceae bacterium]